MFVFEQATAASLQASDSVALCSLCPSSPTPEVAVVQDVEWDSFASLALTRAAVAQLVARRSHNPKVVSSILTCRKLYAIAAAPIGVLVGAKVSRTCLRASNCGFAAGV